MKNNEIMILVIVLLLLPLSFSKSGCTLLYGRSGWNTNDCYERQPDCSFIKLNQQDSCYHCFEYRSGGTGDPETGDLLAASCLGPCSQCDEYEKCMDDICVPKTCLEFGGTTCKPDDNCEGGFYSTVDTTYCCLGACTGQHADKTCAEYGAKICNSPRDCTGKIVETSDSDKCCFEGECISELCVESDSGMDPLHAGTTTGHFERDNERQTNSDRCANFQELDKQNWLHEWYCDGRKAVVKDIDCDDYGMPYCIRSLNACGSDICLDTKCPDEQKCVNGDCLPKSCNEMQGIKCNTDEICSSNLIKTSDNDQCCMGNCNYVLCEDYDGGKEYRVTGKISGLIDEQAQSKIDSCESSDALIEWYCKDNKVTSEKISCRTEFFQPQGRGPNADSDIECKNGACTMTSFDTCIDTEDGPDAYTRGSLNYNGEPFEDFCTNENILIEVYCQGNDKKVEAIDCTANGGHCDWDNKVCVDCPPGQKFWEGKCGIVDMDADTIPDDIDKCMDTAMNDLIDLRKGTEYYGCSCDQGAEEVMQFSPDQGSVIECGTIDGLFGKCEGLKPNYCCNGMKDPSELAVDCGDLLCGPCEGFCTKIIDGGDLDVLLVPIEYSGSMMDFPNNFNDWQERAKKEGDDLVITPPFNDGSMSIWRLDAFNIDPSFEDRFEELGASEFNPIKNGEANLVVPLETVKYKSMCPSIDIVAYLPSFYGRSFTSLMGGIMTIYNDDYSECVICHETGHALCGLDDEYFEDIPIFADLVSIAARGNSLNCDMAPQLWRYKDGSTEFKCKWESWIPDSGCIKGCMMSDIWYRSKTDYEDSMMLSYYESGPADFGKGTWNRVGYYYCQEEVGKFSK